MLTNILAANFLENRCPFVPGTERETKPPYETGMLDLLFFQAGRGGSFAQFCRKMQYAQHSRLNTVDPTQ